MTSFPELNGVLDRGQAPDVLLMDGERPLTGNLSVLDGVTIDGVDVSSFQSTYAAHLSNPLAHSYVRNILDDAYSAVDRSPLTNDVRIYGSDGILVTKTASGLRISGTGGMGGGGGGFNGVKDPSGAAASPDVFGYVSLTSSASVNIESSGSNLHFSVSDLLENISAITPVVGGILVGDGSSWIIKSGAALRDSIGLGSLSSPAFSGLSINGDIVVSGLVDGVDISAHNDSTSAHGATGSVVGTTNVQSLTNKTLVSPTFAPATATVPFTLSANGQGQTVVGLRADQLNKSVTAGNGLTGGGTLTSSVTLAVNQGFAFSWTNNHSWATNKITFGSSVRQMIDLYGTTYGIGIQGSTIYLRTNNRFSVHLMGTHSNTENDPGAGGTNLFTLTTSLITYKGNTIWHAANDGAGSGLDADLWDGYQFSSYLNQAVRTTDTPTFAGLIVNDTIARATVTIGNPASGEALYVGRAVGNPNIKGDGYLIMDSNTGFLALNYYVNQPVIIAFGGGNVGVGTTNPTSRLHVAGTLFADGYTHLRNTGEQLRLSYDANNYASFTVGTGSLTLKILGSKDAAGDLLLDADDVSPTSGYYTNLGSPTKKYLTLHAAELWVDTLVSQEKIATIGGRVIVGQSSSLTRDINTSATTLYLKHNNFRSGDIAYMETRGQIEFIKINSNPTTVVEGSEYSYTVLRNQDGTGAGTWYAGDGIFNTGTTGNGWIDLYSLWSMSGRPLSYIYNFSDSAYSANYAVSASWSPFGDGANNAVNDSVYFGLTGTTWNNLFFNIVTAAVYSATITWEYWNGSAWTAFTPTVSVGAANAPFKNTGVYSVTWSTLSGWAASSVNSLTAYWVRARISAFTSWTTLPVQRDRKVRAVEKQYGPTIVGNIRTGTTWNQWEERWAVGNLDGLYGYGVDTYGVAFGDPDATHVTIDDSNGFRIRNATTTVASWDTAGVIAVGNTSAEHVLINTTGVYIKNNTGIRASLVDDVLTLGNTAAEYALIDTNGISLYDSTTMYARFASTTTIGNTTYEHMSITSSALEIKDGADVYTSLTGGALTLGLTTTGEYVTIDSTNGIRIYNAGTVAGHWKADGSLVIGETANSKSRIEISSGNISIINRSAGGVDTTAISLSSSGSASFTGNITGSTISGTSIVSGSATLDTDGLKILVSTSDIWNLQNGLKFMSGTSVLGYLWSYKYTTEYAIQLLSQCPSGEVANTSIMSSASFGSALIKAETNDSADQSTVHATVSAPGQTGSLLMTGSAGGTTLAISVGAATINSSLTLNGYLRGNQSGNSLRIDTGTGYIDIGPRNTGWAHFYTDRPAFYFDVPIYVNDRLSSYDTDLRLQRAGATKLTLTSSGVNVTGNLLGVSSLQTGAAYLGNAYAALSGTPHLGSSGYIQSSSSRHAISIFSDDWSNLAMIGFGAYPISPKPFTGSYITANNMAYLGGNYLNQTTPGAFSFAGNSATFLWHVGPMGLANHAGITWTKIMSLSASELSVLGSITAPSITLTENSYTSARFVARASSGSSGSVSLGPGTSLDPGYVEWHRPNGTTIGYMGWGTGGENNLSIVLENNAQLRVINGNMGINADPGSYRFRVNGSSYFEGNQTVTGEMLVSGFFGMPDGGTVTAPSNYFEGDSNTGFYRWASDSWSLVAGGVSLIAMTSTRIDIKEELGDWVALTLSSGWANYGGAFSTAQYKKVGDLVFLRGLITSTSWGTYPILATMPEGFRPLAQALFVCGGNSSGSSIRIDVQSNGGIRWVGGGVGSGWISLDNIVFSIK